jgi:hypothetical protein
VSSQIRQHYFNRAIWSAVFAISLVSDALVKNPTAQAATNHQTRQISGKTNALLLVLKEPRALRVFVSLARRLARLAKVPLIFVLTAMALTEEAYYLTTLVMLTVHFNTRMML